MGETPIFYDAGPVITKAKFIGFCYDDGLDECTHSSCGFVARFRECPKCKKSHDLVRLDWDGTNDKKSPEYNPNYGKKQKGPWVCTEKGQYTWQQQKPCNFDIQKAPVKGGKKPKCKLIRFRSYTTEELANPETTDIRYALVEVELAATQGWHLFVADLKDVDFVNREMKVNRGKNGWLAYSSDTPSPVDLSKIINKKEVISQIGKVFGQ
jgi:hypothetical protein